MTDMTSPPDEIERREELADRLWSEAEQPDGRLRCYCGRIFDPNADGCTLSPDPYAMPVCGTCCEKHFGV